MEPVPPIVSAEWVAARRADVTLADVRWYLDGRSGRAAYEAAHLPGAVFVDLDTDLSDHNQPLTAGRHPLPSPGSFAAAMTRLGIGDDTVVVAYDDSGGGTAGRLVVMLRVLGHRAAMLDGGMKAWLERPESGPSPIRSPRRFTVRPWPADRFVTADEVAAIGEAGGVVLDARAGDRFRGETEPVDPRAGHVPGARNAPWAANLDAVTGRFHDPAALRAHYGALGLGLAAAVCYCGSGVSACADVLAIEHAGLGAPRLFVASWSGWSNDPRRAVATGPD